jgi:anti-anti-sigma factor
VAGGLTVNAPARVPAVSEDTYPVEWTGRQAAVTLPEHVDVSNTDEIREELLSVINRGATALIVDMTATVSCDHAGAEAVERAYRRAIVSGTQLRLVLTAPIVRRVLGVNGLDRLIPMYPSLEAAVAAGGPDAAVPVAPKPGGPHTAQLRNSDAAVPGEEQA